MSFSILEPHLGGKVTFLIVFCLLPDLIFYYYDASSINGDSSDKSQWPAWSVLKNSLSHHDVTCSAADKPAIVLEGFAARVHWKPEPWAHPLISICAFKEEGLTPT